MLLQTHWLPTAAAAVDHNPVGDTADIGMDNPVGIVNREEVEAVHQRLEGEEGIRLLQAEGACQQEEEEGAAMTVELPVEVAAAIRSEGAVEVDWEAWLQEQLMK
jgi:hypothetical protein